MDWDFARKDTKKKVLRVFVVAKPLIFRTMLIYDFGVDPFHQTAKLVANFFDLVFSFKTA